MKYTLTNAQGEVIAVETTQNGILKHCAGTEFMSIGHRGQSFGYSFVLNKATLNASFRKKHGDVFRLYRDFNNDEHPSFTLTVSK